MLASGPYDPASIESKWTDYWHEEGLFDLEIYPERPCFSIALPPPNITGNLHMGHALNGTLQDVLIRLKRMQGYDVLWQPGTDHAGISTQMVVERQLRKEHDEAMKKTPDGERKPFNRHEIGREKFIERVWQWRGQYGDQIMNQYRRLGVSFNWDRIAFTMDESYVKAIYKVFVALYKEGLIYRGNRVTNWCPRCLTSLSDLEVEHEEIKGHLYMIKYPLTDGTGSITVATTRPESMFGDVAVAVHPKDDRYKDFVGKTVKLPLTKREIPVIADDYVDREFGTGALKITPAHDANDWEVGQRHKLEQPVVIDEHGKLLENEFVPAQFQGGDRFKVRKETVSELSEKEFIEEIQDYTHGVGHCERCSTVIEPYLSDQWYLSMKELSQPAIEAVEEERVQFIPDRYAATYLDWMRNIRDWNISRQLWWGHRIPVYTCQDCGLEDAFEETPALCPKCKSKNLTQDEDVLDTWFSSALWPFATLGWPEETKVLKHFYPTTVLSTAREIINLWVARMIFMSLKFLGTIPFKHVLIHPVIQTHDGKRMSKSKGNAIDPIDMIESYGADANRFWFASMGVKGDQDVRFRDEKLDEFKKFSNKLWNAGKFVLTQLEGYEIQPIDYEKLSLADRWILGRYNELLGRVEKSFNDYDFEIAARDLHEFIWDHFCDWYVEIAKIQLAGETERSAQDSQTCNVLYVVFEGLLRALHPIMPFITEELWSHIPKSDFMSTVPSIMYAPYPRPDYRAKDAQSQEKMGHLMRVVRSIRNLKQTFDVSAKTEAEVFLSIDCDKQKELLLENVKYIERLARANPINFIASGTKPEGRAAFEIVGDTTTYLPLEKLIDVAKTEVKLTGRLSAKQKELDKVAGLLASESFKQKAPRDKVEKQEELKADLEKQIESIQAQLAILESK
ncbi:MAG: valine--tRNA ligase [Candidatus Obscuribacterales bacterium]|nr:valine--tRNA ligase [Candidatus Obscuribacterales bacterium]